MNTPIARRTTGGALAVVVSLVTLSGCAQGLKSAQNAKPTTFDSSSFESQMDASVEAQRSTSDPSLSSERSAYDASASSESVSQGKDVQETIERDEWNRSHKYAQYAGKPAVITNRSTSSACATAAESMKAWIPGGWTVQCLDSFPKADLQAARGFKGIAPSSMRGMTFSDRHVIEVLNKDDVHGTLVHELAQAYAADYFSTTQQLDLARKYDEVEFSGRIYDTSVNERWARGYAKCYAGVVPADPHYDIMSCADVASAIAEVKKRTGVDVTYHDGGAPNVALNNRKDVPTFKP